MDELVRVICNKIEIELLQRAAFGLFFALIALVASPQQIEGFQQTRVALLHTFCSNGAGVTNLILLAMESHPTAEAKPYKNADVQFYRVWQTQPLEKFLAQHSWMLMVANLVKRFIASFARWLPEVILCLSKTGGISALHNQCFASVNASTNLRVLIEILINSLGTLPIASLSAIERTGMDILHNSFVVLGAVITIRSAKKQMFLSAVSLIGAKERFQKEEKNEIPTTPSERR